ncbi:Dual specificity protein phosphatase, putative [Perkinsus marinus ATCC 50983]|uniref:protein-serine/threonine phosphatase n=1 Tax=Perkinsus marinus (strain ATCC 50983 / TXsc) TaxID=423536 RepID=C5LQV3_PERM5|nr:Dual specificity protein phosphatase, putative [Perkinsus marinus ATCC 50983]EER00838.1 Dual specificity protein phosphatase, putative [Perkinsus marinus ATCC 50983]|eukprot:XP_002768120.1 Dual specificity protein phosphatase, putative [Perkinsus marinus ATCC 50983]
MTSSIATYQSATKAFSTHDGADEIIEKLNRILDNVNEKVTGPAYGGPTRLLPTLYLGNEMQARNTTRLRTLGITHIINMASSYITTDQKYYGSDFAYLGIPCEDTDNYDIISAFDKCKKHYYDAKRSGGAALVHCVMGINRSGFCAIALVALDMNVDILQAASYVHDRREFLLSNRGFRRQLVQWAAREGKLPQ